RLAKKSARDSALIGNDEREIPGVPQFPERLGHAEIHPDLARIAAILHLFHQGSVAIEENRGFHVVAASSAAVIVAVPSLPTTMLLARLASSAASTGVAPAASASVSTAIAVSPAPETSNTVLARADM